MELFLRYNFKKLDKQKKENVNLLFNRIDINEFAKDLNTTSIFSDLILYALQCNDLFKSSKILDKNIKDVIRNIKAKQKQTDRWWISNVYFLENIDFK